MRLHALYTEGSVYIYSGCEFFRCIDDITDGEHVVTSYAISELFVSYIITAERNNTWIIRLLDY